MNAQLIPTVAIANQNIIMMVLNVLNVQIVKSKIALNVLFQRRNARVARAVTIKLML